MRPSRYLVRNLRFFKADFAGCKRLRGAKLGAADHAKKRQARTPKTMMRSAEIAKRPSASPSMIETALPQAAPFSLWSRRISAISSPVAWAISPSARNAPWLLHGRRLTDWQKSATHRRLCRADATLKRIDELKLRIGG
jgi:hypothetical protein